MAVMSYRDLDVWQTAMAVVTKVYRATEGFPREEWYGLTSQIRRAAVSIPSNIAEGRAKRTTKDFLRFVNIAYGSTAELETQLMIAQNLGYLSSDVAISVLKEIGSIGKMLNGLVSGLERKLVSPDSRMPTPDPLEA